MKPIKPFDQYDSLWEYTRDRSHYHFDKWRQETSGQYFQVLGRLQPTWQQELEEIKRLSVSRTWADFIYSAQNRAPVSLEKRKHDLEQGGADIDSLELTATFDNFENYPHLQKTIDFFALDKANARCHLQRVGQMFTMHIDPFYMNVFPSKSYIDSEGDPDLIDQIIRLSVMLEDWEPGQFMIFGNEVYQQWQAGDYWVHDWHNVPHATANASMKVRPVLQITGLRTAVTDEILGPRWLKRHQS